MTERIREVSKGCVDLVAEFEGFMPKPYRDAVGVWTIGYGETDPEILRRFRAGISKQQARTLLHRRLNEFGESVVALNLPLTQAMFDALVSFIYNLGPGAIDSDTGIGHQLRSRHWRKAADEMLRWNKAGGRELAGLTRRREAERELFLSDLPGRHR